MDQSQYRGASGQCPLYLDVCSPKSRRQLLGTGLVTSRSMARLTCESCASIDPTLNKSFATQSGEKRTWRAHPKSVVYDPNSDVGGAVMCGIANYQTLAEL
jgi:hypothetical protein